MNQINHKLNNKVALRNFSEAVDFHDIVRVLFIRMLRRKHKKAIIYTEYNANERNSSYPDIWLDLGEEQYVFEIQEDCSPEWFHRMDMTYNHLVNAWVGISLKYVRSKWLLRIGEGLDPIKSLRNILEVYLI